MDNQNEAPTTEQVLQDTPPPEFIKQQMEAQARVIIASNTLGYLTEQVHGFTGKLTNGNPRLALAIVNELALIYSESIRRSMQPVPQTANEVLSKPEQE